jgi:hypothetical protein
MHEVDLLNGCWMIYAAVGYLIWVVCFVRGVGRAAAKQTRARKLQEQDGGPGEDQAPPATPIPRLQHRQGLCLTPIPILNVCQTSCRLCLGLCLPRFGDQSPVLPAVFNLVMYYVSICRKSLC